MLPKLTLTNEEKVLVKDHYKTSVCNGVQVRAHTIEYDGKQRSGVHSFLREEQSFLDY